MTQRRSRPHRSRQARPHGLGAIAVIVVLVLLATMAAALLRLGQQAQNASTQTLLGVRAGVAARSGLEWGLYQAFKGPWTHCSNTSQTIDGGDGLRVSVSCDAHSFNEGEDEAGNPRVVWLYTLDAVACSGQANCPDAAAAVSSNYVERRRQVQAVN